MSISTEIVRVTPTIAKKWLALNLHNRSFKPSVVERYARSMRSEDWLNNGEPIQFMQNGKGEVLANGQHRLAAVVESGSTQSFVVVRGLPMVAQETMDQGAKRSFGDMLKLRGEKDAVKLAATVRQIYLYETDGFMASNGGTTATSQELFATLERHPDLRNSLFPTQAVQVGAWMPWSHMAALNYLFTATNEEAAGEFFFALGMGYSVASDPLTLDDPIFVLRERLIREGAKPKHERLRPHILNALTVKAFNYHRQGKRVSQLKWRPGKTLRDGFPEIIDCPITRGGNGS